MRQEVPERIEQIRGANSSALAHAGCLADALSLPLVRIARTESLDVRDLLEVIDHVKGVLEDAERNGGGYGFVRSLLEYLGR